ncbi:hypothetical protein [Natrarchaeobius oligotrophus]|uniref:Uncharacterized protein n=1 Tax=Natrarchaeobius chitinivorans TaxID=1679083 RepID=A0A3N6PB70_NATCH|nr:hypothetical protein [Natrarchaeobius chitinivorans]RQG93755.1 hypothetical protein EA472_22765 [Natrarchaeobius chitinivorans]
MASEIESRPPAERRYESVREKYDIDERNDLETFLDAVEGARTVYEVQRELREQRTKVKTALNKLGLAKSHHDFPPVDVDDRLECLRDGRLPEDVLVDPRPTLGPTQRQVYEILFEADEELRLGEIAERTDELNEKQASRALNALTDRNHVSARDYGDPRGWYRYSINTGDRE